MNKSDEEAEREARARTYSSWRAAALERVAEAARELSLMLPKGGKLAAVLEALDRVQPEGSIVTEVVVGPPLQFDSKGSLGEGEESGESGEDGK